MAALDACSGRWGRGTVVPASTGFAPRRSWSTRFEMRSPRYTTRVEELPLIGQFSPSEPLWNVAPEQTGTASGARNQTVERTPWALST